MVLYGVAGSSGKSRTTEKVKNGVPQGTTALLASVSFQHFQVVIKQKMRKVTEAKPFTTTGQQQVTQCSKSNHITHSLLEYTAGKVGHIIS